MAYTLAPHLSQFNVPLDEFSATKPGFTDFGVGGLIVTPPSATEQQEQWRILLLQRAPTDSYGNYWEGPGGGLDPGEDATILAGAAREVHEESGLRVSRFVDLVAVDEWSRVKPDGLHVVAKFTFLVEVEGQGTGEQLQVKLEETEHQAFVWATKEDIEEGVEGRGVYQFVGVQGRHFLKALEMAKG